MAKQVPVKAAFIPIGIFLCAFVAWHLYAALSGDISQNVERIVSILLGIGCASAGFAAASRIFKQRAAPASEISRAADMISEIESSLDDAIESMSDAFAQFDEKGFLVRCNQRYRDLYRYSIEETRPGVHLTDLGRLDRERGVLGTPEQVANFAARRKAQRLKGDLEFEAQLSDGRWISIRTWPMRGGGVVSIQSDITALKNAQAMIEASQKRLHDCITHLDEGFIYFDASGRLVIVNDRYKELFPSQRDIEPGITFEEVLRKATDAKEIPVAMGREKEWLSMRLKQHEDVSRVEEQYLTDGRWVRISERRTNDGGTVGIATDITQLKESLMAAEAANRSKTMFLAHMSHELRTPLNSIIGFSDVIRMRLFGENDPRYRDYADHIHRSGSLLLSLINDILDLSKIETGKIEANAEMLQLDELIEDCLSLMAPHAEQKRINLESIVDPSANTAFADQRHVKQIILNLLSNAIKFTRNGGRVKIETAPAVPEEVEIRIIDTGVGIAADQQHLLFQPFSRVENVEARKHEGTGLGLALVKSLAETNGGAVRLTSAPGEGTQVYVRLPTGHP